jgi:hypothetical protein
MELIYWYALFACLVGIMSLIDLYHPVISKREMSLDTRVIYYVVWFIISSIIAPVLVYPCVRPIAGIEFRDALNKALFE